MSGLVDFRKELVLEDPSLARRAVEQGTTLAAWTIDDPAVASRLVELGVHRITTNQVEKLLAWKRAV